MQKKELYLKSFQMQRYTMWVILFSTGGVHGIGFLSTCSF